jgi:acyl transferase domain-containing protein
MGVELYDVDAEFTRVMDEFFAASDAVGRQLRDDWLTASPGPEYDDCSRAQPLLFAVGCALASAVVARGLHPTVVTGHSVGELAAAAVAGVFRIADSGHVMRARTDAMARTEPGGMLAVACGTDRVREVLGTDRETAGTSVAVAAINSPRQTVLSGATAALARAFELLMAWGVACHPVKARQAFHSPLCTDAAAYFGALLGQVPLRPPVITIRSTSTGRDVTDEEAVDPTFWSVQLARPVLYWFAVDDLLTSGDYLLLEAGPAGSCSAALRRHPSLRSGASVVLPLLSASPNEDGRLVFDTSVSTALEHH